MAPSDSTESLIRLILDRACSLAGCGQGVFYLLDKAQNRFVRAAAVENGRAVASSPSALRQNDPIVTRLMASAEPILVGTGSGRLAVPIRAADDLLAIAVLELDGHIDSTAALLSQVHAYADLAAAALVDREASEKLTHRHADLVGRHQSLVSNHSIERQLSKLVGSGGGLSALVKASAELTGKAVALFDNKNRLVSSANAKSAHKFLFPPVAAIIVGAGPRNVQSAEPYLVAAQPGEGLERRHLVVPVVGPDLNFGWLVLAEYPSRLRAFDEFVARRAAEHLATEFAIQRRVASVAWNARASLTRQLVRGTGAGEDLRSSGEYLGVNTQARRVLIYVVEPSGEEMSFDGDELAIEIEHELGLEVLATRGAEGTVLLVESPPEVSAVVMVGKVKNAIATSHSWQSASHNLVSGISSVCEPSGLPRAYREAREVTRCINMFALHSAARILAVDDLGPARLFVANSDLSAVRGYVVDVLGPLLTGAVGTADLLMTLQCFFDTGRSVRVSATQLGVHENTIRLRLARVGTATGLDVAGDANDQLSVQTALLVLRLQGHPALPSFDEGVNESQQRESA